MSRQRYQGNNRTVRLAYKLHIPIKNPHLQMPTMTTYVLMKMSFVNFVFSFKHVTLKDKSQTDPGNVTSCNSSLEKKTNTNLFCDVYDFSHPKRGYAVFIINSTFIQQSKRPYADNDCKSMRKLFVSLDFEAISLENKTST